MAATFVLFLTSPAGARLAPTLPGTGLKPATPAPDRRAAAGRVVAGADYGSGAEYRHLQRAGAGRWGPPCRRCGRGGTRRALPFALLGGALWSWPTLRLLWGQVRRRGLRGLAAWFGQALVPARGWLETGYRSPLVQALHAPWGLHCGLTPESTYSGQMGKVIAFALEAAGAPIAKGGAGRAVAAFRGLIEEKGGAIRTGACAEQILVKDGRVTGVRLADGEEIACRSVLASVTPGALMDLLAGVNLPEDRAAAAEYRYGRGNFQLHYALDRVPEWRAEGLADVALIHLADGIDSVSKSANEAERGLLPETPPSAWVSPTALTPRAVPKARRSSGCRSPMRRAG
ncbi:phytoene desaturase family protein [Gemmobacter lanyuensis]